MLLSAGAATALAAVTVLAAGARARNEHAAAVAVGWWVIAALDRPAPRPARRDEPADRAPARDGASEHHAARACTRARSSSTACGRCCCSRCSPAGCLPRAADPRHRRRLRDHLGARLAPPGRGGRGDRGARRRRASTCAAPRRVRPMALVRTPGFKALAPGARQRRRDLRCAGHGALDVLIVSLGSTDRAARGRRGAARVARARGRERARSRAAPAAAGAHADAHRPRLGARGARRARGGAARAGARARARDHLLEHDRRAAVAAARARSASTRPRPATGRDATASGSARSSAGAWRRRRCCCRGARARSRGARRRRAREARSSCRCRSSPPGRRRRRATSRRSPTRRTRARRASTACSRPGARVRGGARRRGAEELLVAGRRASSCARRDRSRRARRACASPGGCRARSTARCCAARACSSARRGARTTGIAQLEALADGCLLVDDARARAYAALPLARGSTRGWSSDDLARARCAPRSTTRAPATPSARCAALAPFARGGRRAAGRRASCFRACLRSALRAAAPATARVGDLLAASARRAARWRRPSACSASVRVRCASESITIVTPARRGRARVHVGEVAPVGVGVDLEHRAGSRGGREHRARGRRVGRAASILRPVGWPIASTSGCSMAAIMRSVIACSAIPNDVCIEATITHINRLAR